MNITFEFKKAKIDFSIRKIKDKDYLELFNDEIIHRNAFEYFNYLRRKLLYSSNFNECYVSVDNNDRPMLIIWMISPEEYDKINKIYQDGMPKIASDEILIEGVYTQPKFRGNKIMTETIARLAELAKQRGKSFVVGYIECDNLPSLKAVQNAGFYVDKIKIDMWRFFRKSFVYLEEKSIHSKSYIAKLPKRTYPRQVIVTPNSFKVAKSNNHP